LVSDSCSGGESDTPIFQCDSTGEEAGKAKVGTRNEDGKAVSIVEIPPASSSVLQHPERAGENPPPSSPWPHLPASSVRPTAPQRKAVRFPPLAGSICEANTPTRGGVIPSATLTVSTPFHSAAFAVPTPSRSSCRMLLLPLRSIKPIDVI